MRAAACTIVSNAARRRSLRICSTRSRECYATVWHWSANRASAPGLSGANRRKQPSSISIAASGPACCAVSNMPKRSGGRSNVAHSMGRALMNGDDASRLELLLADIRDAFAKEGGEEIASADLVKALVAIEGRPWAEGGKDDKRGKPMTQMKLAQMLKPLAVTVGRIG